MQIHIDPLIAPEALPDTVRTGGVSGRHKLACSFFEGGALDSEPVNWQGTWGALVRALCRDFPFDRGLPAAAAKKTIPAICCAQFREGALRARENVEKSGLISFDVDNTMKKDTGGFHLGPDGTPTSRPVLEKVALQPCITVEMVANELERAGVTAFLVGTWSSRPDHPRFRVFIPFVAPVAPHLWVQATEFALDHLGLHAFRSGIDIPVLHNPAALAFLPASPSPESIIRRFIDGDPLYLPNYRLAQTKVGIQDLSPWQKAIVKSRANTPGPRWWQTYIRQGRIDDFRDLDVAGILRSLGCWVGAPRSWGNGTKQRCTCPWHGEHSGGVDDDAAVVFHAPGHWPVWHCCHSGHVHLGLRDILEAAWGRP